MARVLVVDDEEDILWGLSDSLKKEGLEVLTAQNGEEALLHLEDGPVDVMVTDIRMPGMNGVELLLKAKELHPEMNVIVMTAYGSDELKTEVLKRGALHYLEKPFDFEELHQLIEKCIREKGSEQPWELADVLQLLNLEGRSAIIEVSFNGEKGKVFIKDGEPWDAEFKDIKGEKALIGLLSIPEMKYNLKFESPEIERTIKTPLYAIILRAISRVDEAQREEITSILTKIGEKEETPHTKISSEVESEEQEKKEGPVAPKSEVSPQAEGPKGANSDEEGIADLKGAKGTEKGRGEIETTKKETIFTKEELHNIIKNVGENAFIGIFALDGTPILKLSSGITPPKERAFTHLFNLIKEKGDPSIGEINEALLRTSKYDILARGPFEDVILLFLLPRKSPKIGMARILLRKMMKSYAKAQR